jgi:hypothetical protein
MKVRVESSTYHIFENYFGCICHHLVSRHNLSNLFKCLICPKNGEVLFFDLGSEETQRKELISRFVEDLKKSLVNSVVKVSNLCGKDLLEEFFDINSSTYIYYSNMETAISIPPIVDCCKKSVPHTFTYFKWAETHNLSHRTEEYLGPWVEPYSFQYPYNEFTMAFIALIMEIKKLKSSICDSNQLYNAVNELAKEVSGLPGVNKETEELRKLFWHDLSAIAAAEMALSLYHYEGIYPTLDEYVKMRHHSIGSIQISRFIVLLGGGVLPYSDDLLSLLKSAAIFQAIENDLVSLTKDIPRRFPNYVSVLAIDSSTTLSDAYEKTHKIMEKEEEKWKKEYEKCFSNNSLKEVLMPIKLVTFSSRSSYVAMNGRFYGKGNITFLNVIFEGWKNLDTIQNGSALFQSYISDDKYMKTALNPSKIFKNSISTIPKEVFTHGLIVDIINNRYKDKRLFSRYFLLKDIESFLDPNFLVYFFEDRSLWPPDADCTAIILSLLLESNQIKKSSVMKAAEIIARNTDQDGIVRAFIDSTEHKAVDPCVCANVLYFMELIGTSKKVKKTETFLLEYLSTGKYLNGTRYYPSPYTFLYFVGRLLSFPRTRKIFESQIQIQLQNIMENGNLNELNALDLSKFLIVSKWSNFYLKDVGNHLLHLISMSKDSRWPAVAFFSFGSKSLYFGSDSLTTAFAIGTLILYCEMEPEDNMQMIV